METPKEPHRNTRLVGLHQLLQKIHQGIFEDCKSPQRTHKEGSPVGMEGRTRRSLSTGSRRVKLCYRTNNKPEGRTRTVASGSLLFHHPLRSRAKLRHL